MSWKPAVEQLIDLTEIYTAISVIKDFVILPDDKRSDEHKRVAREISNNLLQCGSWLVTHLQRNSIVPHQVIKLSKEGQHIFIHFIGEDEKTAFVRYDQVLEDESDYIILGQTISTPDTFLRIERMLFCMDYNIENNNCQHVANYIFSGKRICDTKVGLLRIVSNISNTKKSKNQ